MLLKQIKIGHLSKNLTRMASYSMSKTSSDKKTRQNKQMYDYFLVLDFEATCDDKVRLRPQVSFALIF